MFKLRGVIILFDPFWRLNQGSPPKRGDANGRNTGLPTDSLPIHSQRSKPKRFSNFPIFPHQKLTCWVSISGTTRFWLWCRLYTIFICCILIKVPQGCPSKTSNKLKGLSESISQLEASIQLCWFHPTPFFCSVVNCPHSYVPYNISIFEFIRIHT